MNLGQQDGPRIVDRVATLEEYRSGAARVAWSGLGMGMFQVVPPRPKPEPSPGSRRV